jgi:uncharacterized protein (TIGR03000 family)
MIRRGFVTGIAAIGLAFTMAPPADAQMFFGGRRGGIGYGYGNPGYYGSGFGYGTGYYGSGYGLSGNRFYGPAYGSSGFYPNYGYAASNVYYPSYGVSSYAPTYGATSGGYSSSAPSSSAPLVSTSMGQCDVAQSSAGAAPGIVSGTAPGVSGHTSGYTPAANTVSLTIKVPDANAEVLIDGQPTQTRGTERQFVSPPLENGKYSYKVTARWKEGEQSQEKSRELQVQPGDFKTVDFTSTGSDRDADRSGELRRDENRRDQDRKPLPERPAPKPDGDRPGPKPDKE